jgi:hypothetical protein
LTRIEKRRESFVRLRTSFGSAKDALQDGLWTIGDVQSSRPVVTSAAATMSPSRTRKKVLAGHPGANMPALLTKDVPGG